MRNARRHRDAEPLAIGEVLHVEGDVERQSLALGPRVVGAVDNRGILEAAVVTQHVVLAVSGMLVVSFGPATNGFAMIALADGSSDEIIVGGVGSRRLLAENLRFYAAIGRQRRVVPGLRS